MSLSFKNFSKQVKELAQDAGVNWNEIDLAQVEHAHSTGMDTAEAAKLLADLYAEPPAPTPAPVSNESERRAALRQYLDLKASIEILEQHLDALKPVVFDIVTDHPKGITFEGFKFVASSRNSYEYSDAVKEADAALKAQKKSEEKDGTAALIKSTGFVRVEKERP